MNRYYVGIDTSAYTTSLGVIDGGETVVLNLKTALQVKKGQRGLRQQEAIFQHINKLPILIEKMAEKIDVSKIKVISCSNRPRTVKGSYMPVFLVGKEQAFVLAKVLNCKYKEFSHQQGHIGAGLLNSSLENKNKIIALHISGGTTELLKVENQNNNFKIDIIGGALDLNFGQLIDRIGIDAGLSFPCGIEMDKVSQSGDILDLDIPIAIKSDTWLNISGLENYFKSLMVLNFYKIEDVFATLFYTIARYIYKVTYNACKRYKIKNVLITGGVSANRIIRRYLEVELGKNKIATFFPRTELCTDNGIGIAYMGKRSENTMVGDIYRNKTF